MALKPKPEIIFLGDDEGVSEVAKELDLVHIAAIEKNNNGTPLVSSVFGIGQNRAKHSVVCYINSDIILLSNFMSAVATVNSRLPKFLMIGQRWDVDIRQGLDFASSSWETDLDLFRAQTGSLHSESAMDYFVFPRGMYTDIPPFAIGRLAWDNWLVWSVRSKFIPVVDATAAITIIHQNHDYAAGVIQKLSNHKSALGNHADSADSFRWFAGAWVKLGPEAQRNAELVPADVCQFGIWASIRRLDHHGVLRRRPLSLAPAYLKYQLKWVLPLYSPVLGCMVRWVWSMGRALRRYLKVF
jgi:hypothetical protein